MASETPPAVCVVRVYIYLNNIIILKHKFKKLQQGLKKAIVHHIYNILFHSNY